MKRAYSYTLDYNQWFHWSYFAQVNTEGTKSVNRVYFSRNVYPIFTEMHREREMAWIWMFVPGRGASRGWGLRHPWWCGGGQRGRRTCGLCLPRLACGILQKCVAKHQNFRRSTRGLLKNFPNRRLEPKHLHHVHAKEWLNDAVMFFYLPV